MRLKLLIDGVLTEEIDNRQLALPLLHRLNRELAHRAKTYPAVTPSLLLNVDGLSDLFSQDDRLSQEASQLLDRFVRQGLALGLVVKFN